MKFRGSFTSRPAHAETQQRKPAQAGATGAGDEPGLQVLRLLGADAAYQQRRIEVGMRVHKVNASMDEPKCNLQASRYRFVTTTGPLSPSQNLWPKALKFQWTLQET